MQDEAINLSDCPSSFAITAIAMFASQYAGPGFFVGICRPFRLRNIPMQLVDFEAVIFTTVVPFEAKQ